MLLSGALLPDPEKIGGADSRIYDPRVTSSVALMGAVDASDLRDERSATAAKA